MRLSRKEPPRGIDFEEPFSACPGCRMNLSQLFGRGRFWPGRVFPLLENICDDKLRKKSESKIQKQKSQHRDKIALDRMVEIKLNIVTPSRSRKT